jgi:hypothetical protein
MLVMSELSCAVTSIGRLPAMERLIRSKTEEVYARPKIDDGIPRRPRDGPEPSVHRASGELSGPNPSRR